jgi:serine/threonine-protein kinase
VSPDGRTLLYSDDANGDDIFAASPNPAERRPSVRVIGGPGSQNQAKFSPDGLWITYVSNESGRAEVYLSPYPTDRGPSRQQLSVEGGSAPMWGPDGRTVYFESKDRIYRIRVNPRTGEIGTPEILGRIPPVLGWEVARDGRLLVARIASGAAPRAVKVVLNWPAMLDRKN